MVSDFEDSPDQDQDSPQQPDVFDVMRVRELIELMRAHDLSEIDLREGKRRIRLRRGGQAVPTAAAPGVPYPVFVPSPSAGPIPQAAPATPISQPAKEGQETTAPPPAAQAKGDEEHIVFIRSPMVGTFYAAPDPDSPPYVKVGDYVNPETVVGIVEAMKVFNELPAEVSGKIVAILVENGEAVEYGQPLFKVDTRG